MKNIINSILKKFTCTIFKYIKGYQMQKIRDSFINKIESTASNAIGISVILELGAYNHIKNYANKYPNAKIFLGAGPPDQAGTRSLRFAPTHKNIQNLLQKNGNVLYELYLTKLIQHWFDFLAELYKKIINDKLTCNARYFIQKTQLYIDFDEACANLKDHIIEASCNNFNFLPADKKFEVIRKSLNINLNPVQSDVEQIRVNITVRNALQHNLGIITSYDLKNLGITHIEIDEGKSTTNIVAGQRITRTPFDIENLVLSFTKVAKILV